MDQENDTAIHVTIDLILSDNWNLMTHKSGLSLTHPKASHQNAYAKVKNGFSMFNSQEIGSNLVSLGMIFEALL